MSDFPAMTEEQRQALIEWAKGYISAAETYAANNPNDRSGKAYLELLQIALAALTAKPVGYIDPAALKEYRDKRTGGSWSAEQKAGEYNQTLPIFTAPPAPVLKLPEYESSMDAECDTEIAHNVGWNACINAVKRLNEIKL